jgi:hypothetical protein
VPDAKNPAVPATSAAPGNAAGMGATGAGNVRQATAEDLAAAQEAMRAGAVNKPLLSLEAAARDTRMTSVHLGEIRTTKRALDAQEKIVVALPAAPVGSPQAADVTITINDHSYTLKPGFPVPVPRSVYEILVQSGMIPPQFPEDVHHAPQIDPVVAQALRAAQSV